MQDIKTFYQTSIAAQVARGMSLAFFARAFAELKDLHGADAEKIKLPEEIDPAAHHAAFTLTCALLANADVTDLEMLYERARRAHKTGEGFADMTPALYGSYLALQGMAGGDALVEAFGPHVAALVRVPYVEFGAHSLERDYSGE